MSTSPLIPLAEWLWKQECPEGKRIVLDRESFSRLVEKIVTVIKKRKSK